MLAINLPQSKFKIGYEKKKIIYAQVDGARLTYNFEIGRKISVGLMARGVGGNGNLDFIHEEYNNYLHTNK